MKTAILFVTMFLSFSIFASTKAELFGIWAVSDIRCENNLPVNEQARLRHWQSVVQKKYRFYDNSDGDFMAYYQGANGDCDYLDFGNYRIGNSIMYLSTYKTTSRRCEGSKQPSLQSFQFEVSGNELLIYEEMGFSTNDLCYGRGRSVLVFKLQTRNFYW